MASLCISTDEAFFVGHAARFRASDDRVLVAGSTQEPFGMRSPAATAEAKTKERIDATQAHVRERENARRMGRR